MLPFCHNCVEIIFLALDKAHVPIRWLLHECADDVGCVGWCDVFSNLSKGNDKDNDDVHNKAHKVCPNVNRLVVPLENGADDFAPGVVVDSVASLKVLVEAILRGHFLNDSDVRLVANKLRLLSTIALCINLLSGGNFSGTVIVWLLTINVLADLRVD